MNYEFSYGLIGEHLPHSFSREIHGQIGGYGYELKELAPEELPAFMTARQFSGINVTIPYKQAVIPFLDGIDDTARAIGAVNTVVNRDGKLFGFNTDLDGLVRLIRRIGLDLSGKKVLIPGTGGTSRTAAFAAEKLGAREIHKISRTGREGSLTYEEALRDHTDAEIILNTTPCGMYPRPDAQPLPLEPFRRLEGIADVIYNPLRSRLVLDARSRGIPADGGLFMLVAQAVRASELFLNTAYPDSLADRIYDRILRQKESIVLIGMPGSGKSAVGRILAGKTGWPFADTDQLITDRAGGRRACLPGSGKHGHPGSVPAGRTGHLDRRRRGPASGERHSAAAERTPDLAGPGSRRAGPHGRPAAGGYAGQDETALYRAGTRLPGRCGRNRPRYRHTGTNSLPDPVRQSY